MPSSPWLMSPSGPGCHTGRLCWDGAGGDHPPIGEAGLIDALAARCHHAFAEVHHRHGALVVRVARRYVHNLGDAEDVAQEVFLSLWRRPEHFDVARGSLLAYLSTLARGRAIDRLRSDGARRLRELGAGQDPLLPREGLEGPVVQIFERGRLRRAMNELPERERVPLELAFFGDQTYQAVSILLGIPEGTVKSRIRSGLSRLRSVVVDDRAGNERRPVASPNPRLAPRSLDAVTC